MNLHFSPKKNFGDALNPTLWNWIFPDLCNVFPDWDFYGVGNLLKIDKDSSNIKKLVMGSGYGYGKPVKITDEWNFGFVRGKLTYKKLGINSSLGIGDPGSLIPLTLQTVKRLLKVNAWEMS